MKELIKTNAVSVVAVGALLILGAGPARGGWMSTQNGTESWEVAGNWTENDVPDVGGGSGENAIIGDATADRTITTGAGSKRNIRQLQWTQSAANVMQKIVLNRDFETDLGAVLTNNANPGDGSNMVFDLNGFTWERNEPRTAQTHDSVRYITSKPGGVMFSDTIGVGVGTSVGPGVIMQAASGGNASQGTWDPTAILRGNAARFDLDQVIGPGLGTLQIGGLGFTQKTVFIENNGGFALAPINGDVNILNNGVLEFGPYNFMAGINMLVGGNFIDVNTAGDYAARPKDKIVFARDPVSTRTVSIGRSLGVEIWVGVDNSLHNQAASETGDIELGRDLSTTGQFKVLSGSTLGLGAHTLSTGDLLLDTDSNLNVDVGPASGQIAVTGSAILVGNLALDLSTLTSFTNPIVLIDNDGADPLGGTFANAPQGTVFNSPAGRLALVYDYQGNDLALTMAMIPEPSSLGLLAVLCGAVAGRRRRTM